MLQVAAVVAAINHKFSLKRSTINIPTNNETHLNDIFDAVDGPISGSESEGLLEYLPLVEGVVSVAGRRAGVVVGVVIRQIRVVRHHFLPGLYHLQTTLDRRQRLRHLRRRRWEAGFTRRRDFVGRQ